MKTYQIWMKGFPIEIIQAESAEEARRIFANQFYVAEVEDIFKNKEVLK